MKPYIKISILLIFFYCPIFSQPYIDLFNFSFQGVQTQFKDSLKSENRNENYVINLMAPIVIDSQNTIIVRAFSEKIWSTLENEKLSTSRSLYASMLPIGFQHETKSKKWKYLLLAIPKIASDFTDEISSYDFQFGGMGLITYTYSKNLKLKCGLFYNKEFFGNFFVPIISADWKVTDRFQIYGTFPTFLKGEYCILKNKLFAGISYRSYQRSFRLSQEFSRDYVKMYDMSLKGFVDFYLQKRLVLFAEVGQTLSYGMVGYTFGTKTPSNLYALYSPVNPNFLLNLGLAYRMRFDFTD